MGGYDIPLGDRSPQPAGSFWSGGYLGYEELTEREVEGKALGLSNEDFDAYEPTPVDEYEHRASVLLALAFRRANPRRSLVDRIKAFLRRRT